MTINYTTLLGLAKPVTGTEANTWGDVVNDSITSLLDTAIAGTTTITADTTLTTTTGAANQSRQAILLCSPASANITITAPAQSKIYTVINTSATYTVTVRGVGPTTGVTLSVSESAVVAWNGTDFIRISSSNSTTGNFTVNGNLVVTGNTTLGDADTDTITQAASYVTGTQLKSAKTDTNTLSLAAYDVDGTAYTNLITLTASNTPTLLLHLQVLALSTICRLVQQQHQLVHSPHYLLQVLQHSLLVLLLPLPSPLRVTPTQVSFSLRLTPLLLLKVVRRLCVSTPAVMWGLVLVRQAIN
jgi:hypothetical protein